MAAFTTALTVGLLAGGTALSVAGSVRQGRADKAAGEAQRRAAEEQAKLADFNAAVADTQAKDAELRGQMEENKFRSGVRSLIGEQRAGFAASNIDVGYGSAVDTQADTAMLGELDALTIRTNAAREAWGHRVEATDLRKRAEIARKEGVMMEEAGKARAGAQKWNIAQTIVGAGSSYLTSRYGFGRGATAG